MTNESWQIRIHETQVVNQNSHISFIFSGPADEIKIILDNALDEGALNVRLLNVTHPLSFKNIAGNRRAVRDFPSIHSIKEPQIPVISVIDQSILKDPVRPSERNCAEPVYTLKLVSDSTVPAKYGYKVIY